MLRKRSSSVYAIKITTSKSHTMAFADFSQFIVTAASFTVCETSRDKAANLSSSPRLIYARRLRLSFGLLCLKPAYLQLMPYIVFLFARLRFCCPFFSPTSHDVNLRNRCGIYPPPYGLSP